MAMNIIVCNTIGYDTQASELLLRKSLAHVVE